MVNVVRHASRLRIVAAPPRIASSESFGLTVAIAICLTGTEHGHKLTVEDKASAISIIEVTNVSIDHARRPKLLVLLAPIGLRAR